MNVCTVVDSHYKTMKRAETHCNALQHTALLASPSAAPATHCNVLQHAAMHCNTSTVVDTCAQKSLTTPHKTPISPQVLEHEGFQHAMVDQRDTK